VDLKKLSRAEMIISVAAIVLFIASFLDWFTVKVGVAGFTASAGGNGWDVGFLWGGVPTLIGLVMLAHVAISNFAPDVSLPDWPWGRVHLVLGIVAAALVVLKLIIGEDSDFPGVSVDRAFGIFLAALAAIALAVGGFLYNQEREGATPTAL
jgi:hypothetical protein